MCLFIFTGLDKQFKLKYLANSYCELFWQTSFGLD